MLKVSEIFYSIQGESTFAGRPCAFVRLAGCNLRCSYCDTAYAYGEGTPLDIDAILERVLAFSCGLVEITGGEPLLQSETPKLAQRLLDNGLTVLVETNGSVDIDRLPGGVIRIMDVKCPGSGCVGANDWKNLERLRSTDQVKWIITDRRDFDWAMELVRRHDLCRKVAVLFSPATGGLPQDLLAKWILEEKLPIRLQLQLHKILWPGKDRGC
ncbi:MAG TPA: radical SAM protein [bacterium]